MPDTSLKPSSPAKTARALKLVPPLALRDRVRRYLPSAEQFVSFLKTLVWVVPLTLLIWIYAERENAITLAPETVSIDVKTNDSNRIITLRLPQDKNIIVELSGPRAKLDRVRELLRPNPDGAAVQIYVDPQIGLGPQQLLTVSQINNLPVFKNNGITVKSAQPPYLSVDIDKYETRTVPIKASPEIAGLLSAQTHFVPDAVEIRAPKQMLEKAEEAGPIFAYANLPKRDELKNRTGSYPIDNVPVSWPGHRENVSLTPVTVNAKLDIKRQDVEWTIPSVPIVHELPSKFEERFIVDYPATITNVGVTGPAEQIEAIKKGDLKIKARLEISSLDKLDAEITRPLRFELPPGVSLTPETLAKSEEWKFTIKSRDR